MKLRLLPAAIERIDAGRAWWLGNRDKAPYLFDEELADALELITDMPGAGQRVALSTGRSAYRVLMPKTAFPRDDEVGDDEVHVLSVWGARRADRPQLR